MELALAALQQALALELGAVCNQERVDIGGALCHSSHSFLWTLRQPVLALGVGEVA